MKSTIFSILALTLTIGCAAAPEDGTPNVQPPGDTGTGGTTVTPTVDYLVAKSGGVDTLLINGLYCQSNTATVVGDCQVEGLTWTSGKTVTKNSNGWFTFALTGNSQECHVSLKDCGNVPNTCNAGGTWADYGCEGSPAAVGTHQGGGYMYCGNYLGGEYTCNIAFRRHAGAGPDQFGIVPNGP